MRIIAGSLRGRQIDVPKNFRGRPTTDFAREGLFNLIGHKMELEGASVLDLFSGTGAFSLECFSRGAEKVDSIEISPVHVKFIQKNFDQFNLPGMAYRKDAFLFIEQCARQYDLIFADPPYDIKRAREVPAMILSRKLLKPEGLLIVEHGDGGIYSDIPEIIDERKYGNVFFSFFRNLPV
jgi:16S rRNA (guanine966-N2)-methyltransferase